MSLIRSLDAAIYYEEYGSGEPVVLLPGLLGSIESHWRRSIPEFSKFFHAIVADLRGHGRSNNPGGVLSLDLLLYDVDALLDSLQFERASVCGYSLGGYIGLTYGIRHPGKVRSLVMHATKSYWTGDAVSASLRGLDSGAIGAKIPAFGELLKQDHEPGNGLDGWRSVLSSAGLLIRDMPEKGIAEETLALADFPVLVSVCESDEMIPGAEARRLAEGLPRASTHILDGCKHPMQSVPKPAFVEAAMGFLSAQSTRRGSNVPS